MSALPSTRGWSLEDRLWLRVDKTPGYGPNGDCWRWTGAKRSNGYGMLRRSPRSGWLLVHRVSFEIAQGRPVGAGMVVCHRCDVPDCVNPSHLFEGTQKENVADCHRKGRGLTGERHPQARMSEETARQILVMRSEARTLSEVAQRLGVSRTMVWQVVRGKSWKHLNREAAPC